MRTLKYLIPGVLALAVLGGTGYYLTMLKKPPAPPPPTPGATITRQAIPVPEVPFVDVTKAAGITFTHENGLSGKKLLPETMGGGVAVLDFDRDGWQDLFFVNSCPWPGHQGRDEKATSHLYRNKGNGTFEDVTQAMGLNRPMYGMGVTVGDYNNDGYPDLFISCVGQNCLFRNDGGKRFLDVTSTAGVGGRGTLPVSRWDDFLRQEKPIPFGSSATFVDYDGDGRLDLFVCQYVSWSPRIDLNVSSTLGGLTRAFAPPRDFDGDQCLLYRNIDGTRFEDVSATAGLAVTQADGIGAGARQRPVAKSLGVVLCDPDNDGWPDIVVANDTVRNFFFHNVPGPNGTRVFQEIGERIAVAYPDDGRPRGGMGIDWGEYLPGQSAIVVANFATEPNTFLRLSDPKKMIFSDASLAVGLAGMSRQPLKFGAFYFDFDLDGRLDLLTCNGHIEPDIARVQGGQTFAQPPQLFWNTGDPQRLFEPATANRCGPDLFAPIVGRGSAYLDYDGDGDLDIVLVANGGPAKLLRNDQKLGHHSVRLILEGDGQKSNKSAIGADVQVEVDGVIHRRQVAGAKGYLSQSEAPLTIGMGTASTITSVKVRWPGKDTGAPQVFTGLVPGKTYVLKQGSPAPVAVEPTSR